MTDNNKWKPPVTDAEFVGYEFHAEPYGRFPKHPDGPSRIGDPEPGNSTVAQERLIEESFRRRLSSALYVTIKEYLAREADDAVGEAGPRSGTYPDDSGFDSRGRDLE